MFHHGKWTPCEITPVAERVTADPDGLIAHLRRIEDLSDLLTREKALVFRNFHVLPEDLDIIIDFLLQRRLPYVHGNSPRTKVANNVYTSTEYPPEFTISMHNELSYAHQWPARLLFYCERAPSTGGATPVVDGQLWLNSLDVEVREAFAQGVCYRQNLHSGMGFGKSWQDTFESHDKSDVEAFLEKSGAEWEWGAEDALRITQRRPSTVRHPTTGDTVWFNQADQWHIAGLGDDTAAALATIMSEEELPQSVTFSDGSSIPAHHIEHIRDKGLECAVDVEWGAGDLLLIDNVLLAHGRRPFTGTRRVLVAMSD